MCESMTAQASASFQLAIIGGGPAGYTAAEAAAKGGLSVILFEKNSLGGVCLNEGCIPTKTLLYSAKVHDAASQAAKYGVSVVGAVADLPKIIGRKSKVVRKLVLGIKARLTALGVTVVPREAFILGEHTIGCGSDTYSCEKLLVCTGSEAFIPPIAGLESVGYWTHRDALDCKTLPASLAVIGGGVIGMEFASFYHSLGTKVIVLEMADEILGGIDGEIAALLRTDYAKRGVQFLTDTTVDAVSPAEGGVRIAYHGKEDAGECVTQKVLVCVGRRPVTQGFGLENLNLRQTERHCIAVNEYLQTSLPGVYVCGDLNGKSMLAHTAVKEAETAVAHILGNAIPMDYRAIPGVVYTHPEVASVGKTEEALKAEGTAYKVIKLPMAYSGRFVAENEGVNGVIKVLTDAHDAVLGVHILGNPASELIAFGAMLVADGAKPDALKRYVFPHPTVGEIFRDL